MMRNSTSKRATALKREIEMLEEEKKRSLKGQTGMFVTGVIFLIVFFPVGIIVIVYAFLRKNKATKIEQEIKRFEREIRMSGEE